MSQVASRGRRCPVCHAEATHADVEEIELPPLDGWRQRAGGSVTFQPCGCVESKEQREARLARPAGIP